MSKKVILCVDDEIAVLSSLKTELKNYFGKDYMIEIAESGEEALELLTELLESNYEIPLVIADYIMPYMKGDELLKQVYLLSPKTMKILLTGEVTLAGIRKAINEANLYRYMSKPWQSEDLNLTVKEAVNSYLQNQKLAEQNAQLQNMNQELEALNREQAGLIAKLHENERNLQQILEAIPLGVFVTDAKGKPYYINSRGKQLLGKGLITINNSEQTREFYQIYLAGTEQIYPRDRDPICCALQGKCVNVDDMEIRQDDRTIPIEVWGTPIYDEQGNIAYAIAVFNDISERKLAEAQREIFTAELFQLNQAFSRFVPRQFLQVLEKQSIVDVQVGDAVQQEMSILFSDIREFTNLSEQMTPEQNFKFINSYLSYMEPAIIQHQGFIDKYIGDAIMALFNGSADDALKAGISMLYRLQEYNQNRIKSNDIPINIGVGINTGSLMLGTVGGANRMDGTVISDAVNLAARVESLTKNYGVPLLISHDTYWRLQNPENYALRLIDRVKVKGKSNSVTIYEAFDADKPEIRQGKLATLQTFSQALTLYNLEAFSEAKQLFSNCLQENPYDKVAEIYVKRCQEQELIIINNNFKSIY